MERGGRETAVREWERAAREAAVREWERGGGAAVGE